MGEFEFSLFQDTQVAHLLRAQDRFLNGALAQAEGSKLNSFRCNPHLLCHCKIPNVLIYFVSSLHSLASLFSNGGI